MADTKHPAVYPICFVAILAAIPTVGIWASPSYRMWAWLAVLALMAAFLLLAGYNIKGLLRGCLIDSRNKISLSRIQMIAWTLLVLSAYLVAAFANVRHGVSDPLGVAVPQELWLLMGISTTSLIGSPLVLSGKRGKTKTPNTEQLKATVGQLNKQGEEGVANDGLVVENADPKEAQWADLFRGEETGNAATLDMGKIQMFYFTFIIWIAYATALGRVFSDGGATFGELPPVSQGMLVLLGISHAGYLGHKALPLSKEA